MAHTLPAGRAWLRRVLALGVVLGMSLAIGCLRPHAYLEPTIKDVPATEFKKPEPPKVAHLTFEFRSKGAPNARATKVFTDQVKSQVKESGLFANVDAPASPEVGLLSIAIDNVALADQGDAARKGFVTGFTFGLVGASVSDGYICTLSYLAPDSKDAIVKTTRHAIHTTIGNADPPAGAIPTDTIRQAVDIMVRQILSHALHDLSVDPQF